MNLTGGLRALAIGAWILGVIVALSWAIGVAARADVLIAAGVLLALVPIAAFAPLKPREERIAFAALTVWLGATYAGAGDAVELAGFAVAIAAAIAGAWRLPWLLPVAWFAHIAWDFVPRDLPPLLEDLPWACMAFDGIVGAWLVWRIRQGRWSTPPPVPAT